MTYRLTARNWATESENKIHDDEVARTYGFSGGLVPGVTLFGYLTRPVVEAWGADWLADGRMTVRFVHPVYDGEQVEADMAEDGALQLRNPVGSTCATGTAQPAAAPPDGFTDIPAVDLPPERPPAQDDTLQPGAVLGTLRYRLDEKMAADYLSLVGDDLPLYTEQRVAHPGLLILDANNVLVRNRRLGPWIHAASDVHLLRHVPYDADIEVRGRVVDRYERKGHHLAELDVTTWAEGQPAFYVRHTAIYQPRRRAASG